MYNDAVEIIIDLPIGFPINNIISTMTYRVEAVEMLHNNTCLTRHTRAWETG